MKRRVDPRFATQWDVAMAWEQTEAVMKSRRAHGFMCTCAACQGPHDIEGPVDELFAQQRERRFVPKPHCDDDLYEEARDLDMIPREENH